MIKKIQKIQQNKRNGQKGFTLVELLIYMGLLSILLITITEMFVAILDIKVASESLSQVEQDTQYIYHRLSYDIQRADSISTPTNPGDSSPTLSLSISGENYSYGVNSQNLELTNDSGTFILNGNGTKVTSTNFTKIGPATGNQTTKINITVEGTAQTRIGNEVKIIDTTIGTK